MAHDITPSFQIPELNYISLFEALPGSCILLQADAPRYTILAASPEYLIQTGKTKQYLVGKGMFEAFPPNPNDPTDTGTHNVRASFDHVLRHKEPHQLPTQRYDISGQDGQLSETYWSAINKPVFSAEGHVAFIIHTAEDITAQIKSKERDQEHHELQLAYKKIEESEAKYRTLFESMDQGFCVLEMIYGDQNQTVDYRFLEVNPVFERQSGLKDAIGKTARQLVPDLESHWFEQYGKVALTGKSIRFTEESKAMRRWFDVYALRIGEVGSKRVALLFTDVTEIKTNQQELLTALEQVRLSKEAAELGTFDMNLVTGTLDWDDRCRTLFGISHKQPITYEKDFVQGLHPDDQDRILKIIEKVFVKSISNGDYDVEYRTVGAEDGIVRWIRAKGKVYFDREEKPVRFIGSVLDITELVTNIHKIEEEVEERTRELKAQKSLLNNILTNSSNGITVTEMIRDESGNVIDARTILANDAAVNYIGLPKEIFLSKTAVELDPNILTSSYGQTCLNTLRTGEPALSQYYMEVTGRWQELTISKMDDEHLIHIFTDVTPIKEAQLNLERTNAELRRSNQNLEEFAHAASHDLKEPVRKINFYTTQLKHQLSTQLKEGELRSFTRIENATERMGTLIDDLLLYSHVSQRPHEMEPVDLNEKVQRVLEDLELDVQEKGAIVHVGKLPVVKGYRRQLQQLFQNLISNAIKYSKKDVPPSVEITASEAIENGRPYHLIAVKDNGIGFESHYADRIFQMFTRLHGKAEYSGTGVGLSIVKKVVENHNGFIRVESKPGEGSTFEVLLPV